MWQIVHQGKIKCECLSECEIVHQSKTRFECVIECETECEIDCTIECGIVSQSYIPLNVKANENLHFKLFTEVKLELNV